MKALSAKTPTRPMKSQRAFIVSEQEQLQEQEDQVETEQNFTDLGIQDDILRGLEALGYKTPTPVQAKVIPLLLQQSGDLIALAQTGTGKTAAYGVPLIQHCTPRGKKLQSLVLCPTRELCVQVAEDMRHFSKSVSGVTVLPVYGGADIVRQMQGLRRGVQILVATPGRLLDLMRRGAVDLSSIRHLVLDEADEMLNMGFQEELNQILATTSEEKDTLLFSATMFSEVARIADKYMNKPKRVQIGLANAGAEGVDHVYYMVQARDRYQALKRIADQNPGVYALVFCRTRADTQEVAERLIQDGYNADALHGDLSQAKRDQVMKKFRNRTLQLLVATDVAARGLDVNDLTHVINFQLPDDLTTYTHRSGRTGRAGKKGVSISIIHLRERYRVMQLQSRLKRTFERGTLPSGREICEIQLMHLSDNFEKTEVDESGVAPFMEAVLSKLEHMDREDIIRHLVSFEFQRFIDYYRNAPDLNVKAADRHDRRSSGSARAGRSDRRDPGRKPPTGSGRFVPLMLNVGSADGVNPARLIGQINDVTGMRNISIGKINLRAHSTMLEADARYVEQVVDAFMGSTINGRMVEIKIEKSAASESERPRRKAFKAHRPGGKATGKKGPGSFRERAGKGKSAGAKDAAAGKKTAKKKKLKKAKKPKQK